MINEIDWIVNLYKKEKKKNERKLKLKKTRLVDNDQLVSHEKSLL